MKNIAKNPRKIESSFINISKIMNLRSISSILGILIK